MNRFRVATAICAAIVLSACNSDSEPEPVDTASEVTIEPTSEPSEESESKSPESGEVPTPTERPEASEEPEPIGDSTESHTTAESQSAEVTASASIDGDFLLLRGTASLPDETMLRATVTDGAGGAETLHPVVRDGMYEVPFYIAGLDPGPLSVLILFDPALEFSPASQPPAASGYERAEIELTVTR